VARARRAAILDVDPASRLRKVCWDDNRFPPVTRPLPVRCPKDDSWSPEITRSRAPGAARREGTSVPILDLDPAAREVARLLDGVTDDQLAGPTPCADTTVAALLDHLLGLSQAFTWAAHKSTKTQAEGSAPGPPTAEGLDPNWRTLLAERLGELAQAWRDPMAWTGMAAAGGVSMPAEQMGVVALDELVLHGWDLARATGQQFTCDPASTAAVLAFTSASTTDQCHDIRSPLPSGRGCRR
jgi:uncharacterized protein (TIGR03086 family)